MPRKRNKYDSRPSSYTYTDEEFEVSAVVGWQLNVTAKMLEWNVQWTCTDQTTWEPNCNASGYSAAIFAFLGTRPEFPQNYVE